ncbi:MAG TPA: glycoside hydrolase family 3 N-terminal domain-containing protein, partial [Euzebya sp.]|nr:glycoside hydrolase family 3 N-terminal domain-containing protein [Euzebya sp.]
LRAVHLEPYRRALAQVDSVMMSHLRVAAIDPDLPASVSPAVVGFLRTQLADPATGRPYDGVVLTDDLSMQAVAAVADQPTAVVMALSAGVDLALVGSPDAAEAAHARVLEALARGEVSRNRLRQAAERVLLLKGVQPTQVTCLVGATHYARPR